VPVFIENWFVFYSYQALYLRSDERKWSSDTTVCSKITSEQISKISLIKGSDTLSMQASFLLRISTNNFLKKIGLVNSEKCTFCQRETETLVHLLWECPKIQSFWISLSLWLQSRKIVEKETLLEIGTALGLNPDRSKYKLQINFRCLLAKYYVWICKHKEFPPKLNDFLRYMKHVNEIENKANTFNQKKWDPIKSFS